MCFGVDTLHPGLIMACNFVVGLFMPLVGAMLYVAARTTGVAVRRVHVGQVMSQTGVAEIADGIDAHRIGGHSRGLQAVRARCKAGLLCVAWDAALEFEAFRKGKLFPIMVDAAGMFDGFRTLLCPVTVCCFARLRLFRLDKGSLKSVLR